MILEQIYRNFPKDTIEGEKARMLLFQTHWFTSIAELDPRTAEALPQTLSAVLWKISSDSLDSSGGLKDRLWRITQHVRSSLENLFRELNESPRREHAILPIRAVRELDTTSFMAVARRPGRNIREKLAGKPYMLAVRRIQSVDLPENQLLKAFSEQLLELLELRSECLGEKPDELIDCIYAWLQTDEAQSISYWGNVPPNNTLLTHRDYRAVYDAWCWLQALDDDLTADQNDLEQRKNTISQWKTYGQTYANGRQLFAEMPVLFDYDKFSIRPWTEQIFSTAGQRTVSRETTYETVPVCIDLTEIYPAYSLFASLQQKQVLERKILRNSFLWQSWERSDTWSTTVAINLFNADALYLHSDAVTVSAPELFFSRKHEVKHLDRAAHDFVSRLRETFVNKSIVWLRPDFLNDFELAIIRRNINTAYPEAQPLPRSVAAVFEQFDYKQLSNDFAVVVLDCIGRVKCATKLVAKFDKELKKCLPETRGFYWERHPSVIFSDKNFNEQNDTKFEYDIAILDEHREWHIPTNLKRDNHISLNCLRQNKRIGHFDTVIKLSDSPVVGGIKFFELQRCAGDIPLWRDQIPELSIKAMVNGCYQRFYLVSRGTTVKTIRGRAIRIPVRQVFTLPAGKKRYQFPLYIGEDEEAVGFSAILESPDFPLQVPLECTLNLTFTYGEDDPYCLVFEPIKSSFRPIRVQWTKTTEEIITDAPAPEYPGSISWQKLREFPNSKNSETTDLLVWAAGINEQLDKRLTSFKRKTGTIIDEWTIDKNNCYSTLVQCDDDGAVFRIHSNRFIDEENYRNFQRASKVSFVLNVKDNKQKRVSGVIIHAWKTDKNGQKYTTIRCDNINTVFRIYEDSVVESINYQSLGEGQRVSFILDVRKSNRERMTGEILYEWREDKNGYLYTTVRCNDDKFIRIYEKELVNDLNCSDFAQGDIVSFELKEHNERFFASKVAAENYEDHFYSASRVAVEDFEDKIYLASRIAAKDFEDKKAIIDTCFFIRKSIFFPLIQIWNDGRSLCDTDCPDDFRRRMQHSLRCLDNLLNDKELPEEIKREISACIAYTHKDATVRCVSRIRETARMKNFFEKRNLGFALGDMSQEWQQELFDILITCKEYNSLRVFAYAIWREQNFVNKFTVDQLQSVLDKLEKMLANIRPFSSQQRTYDMSMVRTWIRETAEPLELLLGLLRTRASSCNEIKMLLQPHQKRTKNLNRQIERIIEIFAKSPKLFLFSRVQLGQLPAKPEGDHTPDLLYALRLYLTGDDGANAIQITGVSDDDTD